MDRLVQHNVLAMSGRAVEAAGDVDTLLLDKTGTISVLGNRQASAFIPGPDGTESAFADAAPAVVVADVRRPRVVQSSSSRRKNITCAARELAQLNAGFIPFSAVTRMSGIEVDGRSIRKGMRRKAKSPNTSASMEVVRSMPDEVRGYVESIASSGGTPLVVAENGRALGVIHLKDVVKGGMRERFDQLRAMGIRTIMITGDNPLTAAAIAREAGVDDFLGKKLSRKTKWI